MNRECFWVTEQQFSRLEPHLPTDTRGKPRVCDRRVISGIVHVLKTGARWVDAPDVYDPHKALYTALFAGRTRASGPGISMRSRPPAARQPRS